MKLTAEIILGLMMTVYIVSGMHPPQMAAQMLDSIAGKLLIFCIILYLFVRKHFILGVLAIWAFYDLLRKSGSITGISDLMRYAPTEQKKFSELSAFNQFPYTLEQEMVSKMTVSHFNTGSSMSKYSWKPDTERAFRDAAKI
jgi:hypothetical protein